jgi:hypothetical protein
VRFYVCQHFPYLIKAFQLYPQISCGTRSSLGKLPPLPDTTSAII